MEGAFIGGFTVVEEPAAKNLGRLWLAYTEIQGDFTCYNSYPLTLGTLHSDTHFNIK